MKNTNLILIKDILIPILTIFFSIIAAYLSTKWTIKHQYKLGKYQLFEITNRYFINAYNGLDFSSTPPDPPKTKTSPRDRIYQLEELKAIQHDLAKLLDNPYFIELLKNYPEFSMINVAIRREIIDLEKSEVVTLKPDNINLFYNLYNKIRKDIPEKILNKNENYKNIDKIVEKMNSSMEPYKIKKH